MQVLLQGSELPRHCLLSAFSSTKHHTMGQVNPIKAALHISNSPLPVLQDKASPTHLGTFFMPKALFPTTLYIMYRKKTEDTESRTYSILYLTLYVIIDLAAQQPSPRVPGDHFCCNKSGWEEAGHVCPVAPDFECLSMEVGCVNINFIAHPKEVP